MDQVHSHTIPRKPLQRSTTAPTPEPKVLLTANLPFVALGNTRVNALDLANTQARLTVPRRPLRPTTANPQPLISAIPKAISRETSLLNPPYVPTAQSLPRDPSIRRLSKPPKVHVRKHNTRARLQKRVKRVPSTRSSPPSVFILQFEKYPYHIQPGTLLGAFSTFGTVTTAAIRHGAYAFSKAGIKDGTEYLSPTGRIKIIATPVHRVGVEAKLPRSRKPVHHESHLEVPQNPTPEAHNRAPIAIDGKEGILVAVHQSPTELLCIGAFTERGKAWGACLKHRSSLSFSSSLLESSKWMDESDLPRMKAREAGRGCHEWFVVAHRIDEEVV